jgi:hypothetical protein
MKTDALLPEAPPVVVVGGRRYVSVPWCAAEALREALAKHGCPTTLCLDPEARQARLELWPEVTAEAVQAVLAARVGSPPSRPPAATPSGRDQAPVPAADAAELICI